MGCGMAHTIQLTDEAYRAFEQQADPLGMTVTEYLNKGLPKRKAGRPATKTDKPQKVQCAATGREYTQRAWDLSKKIYHYLRNVRKVTEGGAITYEQLGNALGVHHRTLAHGLGVIQDHCRVRGWPTLTAYVVTKGAGLPSSGCDVTEVSESQKAQDLARAINWPAEPWW